MTTMTLPTELNPSQLIKSSVEITGVLSDKQTGDMDSSLPKNRHGNQKYVFPFWKTCKVCLQKFQTFNRYQALRNVVCSQDCQKKATKAGRKKKHPMDRKGMTEYTCAVCGKLDWKPQCWLKRAAQPVCSRKCNGVLRGRVLAKHAHKGRVSWTEESRRSFKKKMSGENNPAWKGGVTYFRKHGNYKSIKYVRCPVQYVAMARKDGYVMEHRLIVAMLLDRPLLRVEVVHHDDHNPQNNNRENLALFASNRDHKLFEARGTPPPIWHG